MSLVKVGDIVRVPIEPKWLDSARSTIALALVVQIEPDAENIVVNIGEQRPRGQYYYNCYKTAFTGKGYISFHSKDVTFHHRHRLYDLPKRDLFSEITPKEICEITPPYALPLRALPCQINRCDSSIRTINAVRISLAYGSLDHILCEMGLCEHHAHYADMLPHFAFPIRTLWDEFDGRSQSLSLSA